MSQEFVVRCFHGKKTNSKRCIFQLFGYQRLVLRVSLASDMDLIEKRWEIQQVQEKLMKTLEGSEELEMAWWSTCADASSLPFKKGDCEEDQIIVEVRPSLQREVLAVQWYSAGESAETLKLFRNEAVGQELRDFLGYDPKRKQCSKLKGTIMSIARLDACVATVICCPVENEKCGGHRLKEYANTYLRIVQTSTRELVGNARKIVTNWS